MKDFSLKLESKKTNRRLAKFLRHLRITSYLTMRELAEKVDSPHSLVGKIELQGRRVDVGEFIHYCRAMKRDPAKELQNFLDHKSTEQYRS